MYRTSTKCTDRDVVAHVEQGQHIQVEEVAGVGQRASCSHRKVLVNLAGRVQTAFFLTPCRGCDPSQLITQFLKFFLNSKEPQSLCEPWENRLLFSQAGDELLVGGTCSWSHLRTKRHMKAATDTFGQSHKYQSEGYEVLRALPFDS